MEIFNKNVLVTGANGFIGKYVCEELIKQKVNLIKFEGDLRDPNTIGMYKNIDIVIHLAGYNGGIAFNGEFPYDIFADNTIMANNAMKIAINCKSEKFVTLLTSCGYPPENGEDLIENTYLDNKPHETIESHGYAKRNLLLSCKFANKQYGLNTICLIPNTVYGPGDRTDPIRTKVMMALIKKIYDAKVNNETSITCWGTGKPCREFIYVKDVAKLIVESVKKYNDSNNPLNLSTGQVISIGDLTKKISETLEFNGDIKWDTSKPDGQKNKTLNTIKMMEIFPNFIATSLEIGIKETINWYKNK
jgi:nucleoside-diphosphate-sugar epimerase